MKILIVTSFYAPDIGGGAEGSIKVLADSLVRAGNDVVVICLTSSPIKSRDLVDGIPVWRMPLSNLYWHLPRKTHTPLVRKLWHLRDIFNFKMARELRRIIRAEAPDVASVHNLSGWSVAAWSALSKERIPVVQVLHDQYLLCPVTSSFRKGQVCQQQCFQCAILRAPHARLSRLVDGVMGVSNFVLSKHIGHGYFPKAITDAVHDVRGISMRRSVVERVLSSDGAKVFGFIGSVAPNKGIEALLRVFHSLRLGGAVLLVAGSGAESYVQPLREKYSSDSIIFLGQVAPADFYSKVDVVVVPSLWDEPLGCVVFESFIFGRPVIAAKRGGIPEMVRHDENGLLVEPTSDKELGDALRRLHDSPSLFERMSRNAADSAGPYMDIDAWVKRYESMYSQVIEQKRGVGFSSAEKGN